MCLIWASLKLSNHSNSKMTDELITAVKIAYATTTIKATNNIFLSL